MAELVAIVPTRERPHAAVDVLESFRETCTADTQLVFAVDETDPAKDEYRQRVGDLATVAVADTTSMNHALNTWATRYANQPDPPFAIMFLGDDHRPRTKGWDARYLETLRQVGSGIVYGNDLLQRANLPTQCAMTSDIVRALGYFAPPELVHLYLDNTWLEWGKATGRIRYLDDVIVEHMHPFAEKAQWDAGYIRVNQRSMYERDAQAFARYRSTRFNRDVAKIRALKAAT